MWNISPECLNVWRCSVQQVALLGQVMEPWGGGRERGGHWGQDLRFYNPAPLPVHSLLPAPLGYEVRTLSYTSLVPSNTMPSSPWWTVPPWPDQVNSSSIELLFVRYLTMEEITNTLVFFFFFLLLILFAFLCGQCCNKEVDFLGFTRW